MIKDIIIKLRREYERLLKSFFVFLVCLCGFDFFVERHDTHFWGDRISCFWAVFAFLGCVVMGLVCKSVLSRLLLREEDYYEEID